MATENTEGLVLEKIDYSESSIILKVFTQDDGLKSFIFKGAKNKKKKGNLIFPLSFISIEYYKRKESDLSQVKSIDAAVIYKSIPFDPYKSSVVFFMIEVLLQTMKEQTHPQDIYTFLKNALQILDLKERVGPFPIKFLFELTRYLGFYPKVGEKPRYFDLQESKFTPYQPSHPFFLSEEKTAILLRITKAGFDEAIVPSIPVAIRRELIHDLIDYYRIIIDGFKELKSLAILESTLHE